MQMPLVLPVPLQVRVRARVVWKQRPVSPRPRPHCSVTTANLAEQAGATGHSPMDVRVGSISEFLMPHYMKSTLGWLARFDSLVGKMQRIAASAKDDRYGNSVAEGIRRDRAQGKAWQRDVLESRA